MAGLQDNPFDYQPGTFQYLPLEDHKKKIVIENVGIRLKGRNSFQPMRGKPAFKIKFNAFESDKRFMGLRRLTLNNMLQDPSMVRERLGYLFFRRAGVKAPLCNHARVYVNGSYYGLYANVQTLDKSFLEQHYQNPTGNLYDTPRRRDNVVTTKTNRRYVLETNTQFRNTSYLETVMKALDSPKESFMKTAQRTMDLDAVLLNAAVDAIIANWDGHFGNNNNYKIYKEVESDALVVFPWGIDQTFGGGGNTLLQYAIDGSTPEFTGSDFFIQCRKDQNCFSRYKEKIADALEVWESLYLEDELKNILSQIDNSVREDRRKPHSDRNFNKATKSVREFISQRGNIVCSQLTQGD